MQNKTILVTGGAGYVGSVLIPSLIEEGHYVKCLDRFFFGKQFLSNNNFSKNLELIQDDLIVSGLDDFKFSYLTY